MFLKRGSAKIKSRQEEDVKKKDKNQRGFFREGFFYNHGHNILRLLILYQIFFSPQVKRSVIISNKHSCQTI